MEIQHEPEGISLYNDEILDVSNQDSERTNMDEVMDIIGGNSPSKQNDAGAIDEPGEFFASIAKGRETREGQHMSRSNSFDSSNAEETNDEFDSEAFFAKIAKARQTRTETRENGADTNSSHQTGSQDGSISKAYDEEIAMDDPDDDPDAFLASIAMSLRKIETKTSESESQDQLFIDDPGVFPAKISKAREKSGSKASKSDSQDSSKTKESDEVVVDNPDDDPDEFLASLAKSLRRIETKTSQSDSQDSPKMKGSDDVSVDDPGEFFASIAKARGTTGSKSSKADSQDHPKAKGSKRVSIDDPRAFFARIAKSREASGSEASSETSSKASKAEPQDGSVSKAYDDEIAMDDPDDDPDAFLASLAKSLRRIETKTSQLESREDSPKTKGSDDISSADDPGAFFASIAKHRGRTGTQNSKSDSRDSSKRKGSGEVSIDDPNAFFANIAKARKRDGTQNSKADSQDDSRDGSKTEESNKVSVTDPEDFFAKISKARKGRSDIISNSNSEASSSAKRSKESAEGGIDKPEALFANISRSRESPGSNHSKSESDLESVSKVTSDEEPMDDPEVYFANLLRVQEAIQAKNTKYDRFSEQDDHYNDKFQEPKIVDEEYLGDVVDEDPLGDSYGRFLAGLSDETPSDDIPLEELQKNFVTTDPPDEQYESHYGEEEQEEITFLHEEMKKIGLSPTIFVGRDDATQTSRSSIGGDSYLEDLLMQREERGDDHREEIMNETLEHYDAIDGPKSEDLFLDILGKVTKEKQKEFAERDLLQDKLISEQLELREQSPSLRYVFSGNKPKTKQQKDAEQYPEIGQPLPTTPTKRRKTKSRPERSPKKKNKATKPVKESRSNGSSPKRNGKKGANQRSLPRPNDGIDRSRKKKTKPNIAPGEPTFEQERPTHSTARRNDDIERSRKKKTTLPKVVEPQERNSAIRSDNDIERGGKQNAASPKTKERTARASRRGNNNKERVRNRNGALPRVAIPVAIPEEEEEDASVASSSSKVSINGFEDEYYYDEERAEMDRTALLQLQQEAQLFRQEFRLTKRRMIASSAMCCLAFALILVFILDPLRKRQV